jgi:hypothetical protein
MLHHPEDISEEQTLWSTYQMWIIYPEDFAENQSVRIKEVPLYMFRFKYLLKNNIAPLPEGISCICWFMTCPTCWNITNKCNQVKPYSSVTESGSLAVRFRELKYIVWVVVGLYIYKWYTCIITGDWYLHLVDNLR